MQLMLWIKANKSIGKIKENRWWMEKWKLNPMAVCKVPRSISIYVLLELKFNVDSQAHGKLDSARWVSVLRDSNGQVRGVFYDPLGIQGSNYVR